ncbi:MAG: MBL fold metallo-hydrolase, partial [Deltaproteobacteria bacterium]|nr:MBL fold metallo-hydrolase [Deltaproteobacteria bacterium]
SGLNPADIKYLILTHCHIDHTGGANYLRETTGAKIIAHTNDAEPIIRGETVLTAANWYNIQPIPTNIDIRIEGDSGQIENIPRIKWYHIPGHTPGSIALLYEKDNIKILFGQDIHGPLSPLFKSDREDYLKSLEMLIGLNADILCEGHYGIIRGKNNVKDFIARFINTGGQE